MNQQLRQRLERALRAGASGESLLQQAFATLEAAAEAQWREYAGALGSLGAAPLAAAVLGRAAARWPRSLELRCDLGRALRLSQQWAQAEAVFRDVLREQPRHEGAALSLAFMLRDQGRMDAAAAVMQALWKQGARDADSTLKAGRFLQECARPQRADEVYEQALAQGIGDPRVLAGAGDIALTLGDFERSRQRLLAAVQAGLDGREWTGVALMLANGQQYRSAGHPDFARFEQAWNDARLDPAERLAAGFALGKARADLEDFAGAVAVLRQANALQRARRPWNAAAWEAFVAAQIAGPAPPPPLAPAPGPVPVFVVGLPRTGTTLVTEKLAGHAQVRGRGEMNWLPFLAHELAASRQLQDGAALRQAASIYRAQLHQDDAPAGWYIDKNPHNFRHLGLIQALFPDARVIHCVRGRRDTALSIWSQLFAHQDVDYAYDLADIAAFADGHDRLMRHWRQTLRLPLFELHYEELVAQPETTLRRLWTFLGVEDAGSLAPVPATTAISTASVWQARQPVYRGAVGRWRAYAPYLPELLRHFPEADGVI